MSDALLGQISETVASAQTVEQLTRPLLTMLELVTGLESTYLTRIDEEAGVQSILYARNSKVMQIPEGLSVPWDDTLCKRALDAGQPFTDDVAGCWGDSDAARALGICTYASTPVRLEDGSLFGTLCAASSEKRPITSEGRQVLILFGALIQQHIQRENLLERLQRANRELEGFSFTDTLTGLPNRRFIFQELGRLFSLALREGRRVTVAFIDLDGFKQINDTYGHECGDAFLIEVGRRLSAGMRGSDLLGRLGGDEFVLAGLGPAQGQDSEMTVAAMRRRLAGLIEGQYDLPGCSMTYPGASLGIVSADPRHTTVDQALQDADAAMYLEKRQRREARAQMA
ncbi:sensor domain-containing diguanylate cyclase [Novosphingobium humi]|uniref:sensor domain-containing diguanylate cyclase n=1 Tax=Novosphingobium humi TaxID=2282397 RepID=UPI0025B0E6EE|nr:sensor domain-containing diguanylate cyclase [Novosphingobium humi]WJS97591.1 sensor domain-containing diguanylate cyclase [Novosphingobium humi]